MLWDPLHKADNKLMMVETDDEHFVVSGADVLVFAPRVTFKKKKINSSLSFCQRGEEKKNFIEKLFTGSVRDGSRTCSIRQPR